MRLPEKYGCGVLVEKYTSQLPTYLGRQIFRQIKPPDYLMIEQNGN